MRHDSIETKSLDAKSQHKMKLTTDLSFSCLMALAKTSTTTLNVEERVDRLSMFLNVEAEGWGKSLKCHLLDIRLPLHS